jgi:hypothetical protein
LNYQRELINSTNKVLSEDEEDKIKKIDKKIKTRKEELMQIIIQHKKTY